MQASKKLSWAKSMDAQIAHEQYLYELAKKAADGANITVPMNKSNKAKFTNLIEDAKVERLKRMDRDRKKAASKKNGEAQ